MISKRLLWQLCGGEQGREKAFSFLFLLLFFFLIPRLTISHHEVASTLGLGMKERKVKKKKDISCPGPCICMPFHGDLKVSPGLRKCKGKGKELNRKLVGAAHEMRSEGLNFVHRHQLPDFLF